MGELGGIHGGEGGGVYMERGGRRGIARGYTWRRGGRGIHGEGREERDS